MNLIKILPNGLKKYGLFPFNADAIDYSKVLCQNENQNSSPSAPLDSHTHDTVPNNVVNKLEVLKILLTLDQLEAFRINGIETWNGLKEDKNLYTIWYKLSHSDTISRNIDDDSTVSTDDSTEKELASTIENTEVYNA